MPRVIGDGVDVLVPGCGHLDVQADLVADLVADDCERFVEEVVQLAQHQGIADAGRHQVAVAAQRHTFQPDVVAVPRGEGRPRDPDRAVIHGVVGAPGRPVPGRR